MMIYTKDQHKLQVKFNCFDNLLSHIKGQHKLMRQDSTFEGRTPPNTLEQSKPYQTQTKTTPQHTIQIQIFNTKKYQRSIQEQGAKENNLGKRVQCCRGRACWCSREKHRHQRKAVQTPWHFGHSPPPARERD